MSHWLHNLTIKPKAGGEFGDIGAATFDDLSIQLDGIEIKGLRSLDVHLSDDDLNIISMEFAAEVEIDIEGVIELQAEAKKTKDEKGLELGRSQ